jgi:hypothetical protein
MAEVQIRRNEVPDPATARLLERELAEAAGGAECEEPLRCVILDEGLHAEIEIEMPGWTETVRLDYPVRAGDARRAFRRWLREVGLLDAPDLRISDLSRRL